MQNAYKFRTTKLNQHKILINDTEKSDTLGIAVGRHNHRLQ